MCDLHNHHRDDLCFLMGKLGLRKMQQAQGRGSRRWCAGASFVPPSLQHRICITSAYTGSIT